MCLPARERGKCVAFIPNISRLSVRIGYPGIQVAPLESSEVSCLTLRSVNRLLQFLSTPTDGRDSAA